MRESACAVGSPPGFPYPLIDRVVCLEPGVRAVGVKLVSVNEPYFRGHFPGAPVLPGVLMCEAFAQLGAYVAGGPDALRLVAVERARFRRVVVPGDELRLEVARWGEGPTWHLRGVATVGQRTRLFQFASVGAPPQDRKYRGEPSTLELGDDNVVREFASLHPGTASGGMATRVGNGCLFMATAHVAHDCLIGNHVIIANGGALGGHCVIEDHAIVGALAGVHQFARIGESALCAAGAMVALDVPPFCIAAGDRARLRGVNVVGLRRRGVSPAAIQVLKRVYRVVFHRAGLLEPAIARAREVDGDVPEVARLLAFLERSERGVCRR